MPLVRNLASQGQPEQLIKVAMQEYYRNSTDPTGWPGPKVPLRSQLSSPQHHTGHIPMGHGNRELRVVGVALLIPPFCILCSPHSGEGTLPQHLHS